MEYNIKRTYKDDLASFLSRKDRLFSRHNIADTRANGKKYIELKSNGATDEDVVEYFNKKT